MITIQQAIINLRPGVEWTMNGDDVENIVWHTEGVEPLTTAEVESEIERLEAEREQQEQVQAEARTAAIAHAKSLGFTDEMIAVMYPSLGVADV